jgi:hypothetical protein
MLWIANIRISSRMRHHANTCSASATASQVHERRLDDSITLGAIRLAIADLQRAALPDCRADSVDHDLMGPVVDRRRRTDMEPGLSSPRARLG